MSKTVHIEINNSTIRLQLNESWYFYHYLKNISNFYNNKNNESKKVMIVFPGTQLHVCASKKDFNDISRQVESHLEIYDKESI